MDLNVPELKYHKRKKPSVFLAFLVFFYMGVALVIF